MTDNRTILLTPGPLTTSQTVKDALNRDWGSRDVDFIALTKRVREELVRISGGTGTHVCVPMQGSGTFAVEGTLGTLVPSDGKLLVLINGAYGKRMAAICEYAGKPHETLVWPEDTPVDAGAVEAALTRDDSITHVAVVHCETTSGLLNPVTELAKLCQTMGKHLLIDAMSSFGAIPLTLTETPATAIIASSNKNLEGVPGMGYAIVREDVLAACEGRCHSLSLDMFAQWKGLEKNGQWRFTPPVQVLAALGQAIDEHTAEGGVEARHQRYNRNRRVLVDGLRELGFQTFLSDELQAPIIVTFLQPADDAFDFNTLYTKLGEQGIVIYPGKVTEAPSFRIGCIGQVFEDDMQRAVNAIGAICSEMGITNYAPAATV